MYCGKCGSELDDDAIFCTECGTKIARDDTTSVAATTPEPAPVQPGTTAPVADADNPKKKRTGLIIAIAAAVVVVIAIVGIAIWLVGSKEPQPEQPKEAVEASASSSASTAVIEEERPLTKADFEDNPVYGETVKMYERLAEAINTGDRENLKSQFPDIPEGVWDSYGKAIATPGSQVGFSAAFVNIGNDRVKELLIGGGAHDDGEGEASFVVLYGIGDGKAVALYTDQRRASAWIDESGFVCFEENLAGGNQRVIELLELEGDSLVPQYSVRYSKPNDSSTATVEIQESPSSSPVTKTMTPAEGEALFEQFRAEHPAMTVTWTAL
ncbi:MAG: zinc ribbon domain-containing protein [Coriobacteriales bacterium]